jgi:ankyrin repeat protein
MHDIAPQAPSSDRASLHAHGSDAQNAAVPSTSVHTPLSRCRRGRDEHYFIKIGSEGCVECGASKAHYLARIANSIKKQDLFEKLQDISNDNPHDIYGNTPLHFLASLGPKPYRIQTFKGAGADLSSRNVDGDTFLHVLEPSELEGFYLSDLLAWCDENGFNLKQRNLDGKTFLHCLLDRGLSYNNWVNILTTLHSLRHHRTARDNAFSLLADYLHARDNQGRSILNIVRATTDSRYLEAVASFISLPQLCHYAGYTDNNPSVGNSHVARSENPGTKEESQLRDKTMRSTVEYSATNPSATNPSNGMNAISCLAHIEYKAADQSLSARGGKLKECLKHGVDPNGYDCFGSPPLHYFLSTFRAGESDRQTADLIALLVRYGADVNMRNSRGESPLHVACQYGRVSCVERLIKLKADVWALDYRNQGIVDMAKLSMDNNREASAHIPVCIDLVCCKMDCLSQDMR